MTRNQKREIKRLMALGIQRNDAAGYLKVCRLIEAKGHRPLDYIQPLPVIISEREIKKLVVCHMVTGLEESTLQSVDTERYVKHRLAGKLGHALVDHGLCSFSKRACMDPDNPYVSYRATIDVAVPQEVRV